MTEITSARPGPGGKFRLFTPILTGVTLRERLLACLGVLIGITLTSLLSGLVCGEAGLPLIIAPIGASAVLLFVVPASPLAQPWPIIGGNTLSALVGISVAHFVHTQMLAIGIAVALAILVMSLTRSLHPPGGALALAGVLGGPAISASGFLFPFIPVALNAVVLVAVGIIFHGICKRSYPHAASPLPVNTHDTRDLPSPLRVGFHDQDIDAALQVLGESFDIGRDDIDRLLRQVEHQSLLRTRGAVLCRDIMSRDVILATPATGPEEARALLLRHNIRTLPVVDADGVLTGVIGLRELALGGKTLAGMAAPPATATAQAPAITLAPLLTNGHNRAVVIIDEARRVLGLVTQTDLLSALALR